MNKRINKFTIMLAAAILSSMPCAAYADVNKDIKNNIISENDVKITDAQEKEDKNKSEIGWKKNNDSSYSLIDGKGNMVKSNWCKVGGKWYYFDENGIMQKGWVKSDGKWYCLDTNGNPKDGWILEKNNWYYFGKDGAMQTGWNDINGSWYYFNGKGEMAIGWQQINSSWYFFDDSGKMLSNTVIDGCRLGPKGNWV